MGYMTAPTTSGEQRKTNHATTPITAMADALKPYYNQFCKRPCFHEDYLPTFNRPNVHLIDTDGKGVTEINERGVVANGQQYDLDCLVYATGFEGELTPFARRAGHTIVGRGGVIGQASGRRGCKGLRLIQR